MKHLCGKCGKGFANEPAYLKHICPATGFSPGDPQHFATASKAIPDKKLPKENIVYLSEEKIVQAVKKARREG